MFFESHFLPDGFFVYMMFMYSGANLQVSQHYSKPGVTAVEVLPVFPDFEVRWASLCISGIDRLNKIKIFLCL